MWKNKKSKNNPWDFPAVLIFEDINVEVKYNYLTEIAMGSPLMSSINLIKYVKIEIQPYGSFGGPPVVDLENMEIAIPQWINREQKIRIFDLKTGESRLSQKVYRVLHLKKFSAGRLTGIDSPIYQKVRLVIDTQGNDFY